MTTTHIIPIALCFALALGCSEAEDGGLGGAATLPDSGAGDLVDGISGDVGGALDASTPDDSVEASDTGLGAIDASDAATSDVSAEEEDGEAKVDAGGPDDDLDTDDSTSDGGVGPDVTEDVLETADSTADTESSGQDTEGDTGPDAGDVGESFDSVDEDDMVEQDVAEDEILEEDTPLSDDADVADDSVDDEDASSSDDVSTSEDTSFGDDTGAGDDTEVETDSDSGPDASLEDTDEPSPIIIDETTCEGAAQAFTSAGCLFAPFVGNPSSETYMGPLPWAVIAANTNELPTVVSLYAPDGQLIDNVTINGGELHVFELDGQANAVWEHPEGSGIFDLAMRLESTAPIVAYQFQPYSSSYSATADATLLLPKHAWGTNHLVLSAKGSGPMWVTIVSLDDDVEMRIRMPESMSGSSAAGGGIPALSQGDIHLLSLNAGQTARIFATGTTDLSGMRIFSGDGQVAVFVGSPGTSLPGPSFAQFNDYLEEQVPPRTAWGKDVSAVKFRPRGDEVDVYRIMADKNGTLVDVEGDYNDTFELNEGEFVQFSTDGSFRATASEAILVAHGMVSSSLAGGMADPEMWPGSFVSPNCSGNVADASNMGDPALSFLTPTEQFRNDYVFLTPYTYGWDVLTLLAPLWAWDDVLLDGEPLPDPELHPGDPDLGYVRLLVADGTHQVTSEYAGVGIEVYGYDCRLSYAYSGGLSLGAINEPPPDPDAEQ